jgi:hypothetical protein
MQGKCAFQLLEDPQRIRRADLLEDNRDII